MIIYCPEPMQLIDRDEQTKTINLKLPSGGHLVVQPYEYNKLKVLNIVSTDPMDYMNTRFQPGSILEMELHL